MFRLHKNNKPSKSGERIEFKFSNFQAIQVPKGWDKLYVSIISVETGKTVAKSSKALTRGENCQWTETLSESVWIPQDDSQKELEECLYKFVVAMGSARTGILGEATVNMAGYTSSKAPVPVLLPLKKCKYDTSLQVKIHCLTPRPKRREKVSKDSNSHVEDQNEDHHDMDSISNGSEKSFERSVGSSSSKDLSFTSHPGDLGSQQTSFSTSESYHSSVSPESPTVGETFSPRNKVEGEGYKVVGTQDSTSPKIGSDFCNDHANDPSQEKYPSSNSRISSSTNYFQNHRQDFVHSSSNVSASSTPKFDGSLKSLLESAEVTIEELRAECTTWERNTGKLMVELDILRKEFSDLSKKQADSEMELSAAHEEGYSLKKEVEQLKLMLEESTTNRTAGVSSFPFEGAYHFGKESENEMKLLQESNASLVLQLKGSQESNIEFVSILQEMEETIEKQKVEIENERSLNKQAIADVEAEYKSKLSAKEEEVASLEEEIRHSKETRCTDGSHVDLIKEIEILKENLQELEKDCSELTDENLELVLKLKDLGSNSMKEQTLFTANSYINAESEERGIKSQVNDLEGNFRKIAMEADHDSTFEISKLFHDIIEQLQVAFYHVNRPWYNVSSRGNKKLETDLDDLVDLSNKGITEPKVGADFMLNFFIKLNKLLEAKIIECEEVLKHGEIEIKEMNDKATENEKKLENYILKENDLCLSIQEFESLKVKLETNQTEILKKIADKESAIENLEANLQSKDEAISSLMMCKKKFEVQVSDLVREKDQLEERMEIMLKENDTASKSIDDLQNDLLVLRSTVDSHNSAKVDLERKLSVLEGEKCKLEHQLLNLGEDNVGLSEHTSSLEARVKYLIDEKDLCQLEVENSKSITTSLADEIIRLGMEMEIQKVFLNQKLWDLKTWLSEAQEECEYLKTENQKFEAFSKSLAEKCSILQESHIDLRKEKSELHEHIIQLETNLRESELKFTHCSKNIESLEECLSLMLEDICLKEESIISDLDTLLQGKRKQNDNLIPRGSVIKQTYLEKTGDIENLQRGVQLLSEQISATRDEKQRIMSEAACAISSLRADKAKLEAALLEAQSDSKTKNMMVDLEKMSRKDEHKIDSEYEYLDETPQSVGMSQKKEVEMLQNELAEALEANGMYKLQLKRLLSEGENICAPESRKPVVESEVPGKERYERTRSSLETELKDLRERYFHMSLKYAEVEAQREDLVMKLKETKTKKRWFS